MWKKKIGVLFGVVLLTGVLSACGGDTDSAGSMGDSAKQSSEETAGKENSTKDKSGESTEAGEKVQTEKKDWETREVAEPTLPEMSIREVEVSEGVKIPLATTSFDFSLEKLYEIVNKHPIVTDNFVLYDGKMIDDFGGLRSEEGEWKYEDSYYVYEGIAGEEKEDPELADLISSPFLLRPMRNTDRFENWNELYIKFAPQTVWQGHQEEIYALLADLVGAEVAEYLVYQKNTEKKLMEAEITTSGGATYALERSMQTGGWLEFTIGVTDPGFTEVFAAYNEEHEHLTDCMKYNFEQFSAGLFPDFSLENKDTYLTEHMKLGVKPHLESLFKGGSYEEMQQNDTQRYYYCNLTFQNMQDGVKKGITEGNVDCYPTHFISYHVYEENGVIDGFKFEYSVDMSERANDYELEDMIDSIRAQIQYLFPDLDLSTVTVTKLEKDDRIHLEVPVEVMGKEIVYWIDIYDSGNWRVALNY